jgi:LacI family transcriptional regulator
VRSMSIGLCGFLEIDTNVCEAHTGYDASRRTTGRRSVTEEELNSAAGRRVPVTLTEVAARAGVSRATAARALGGYGSVSDTARALVEAAAAELKYRPNGMARSTRTGTTSTVGVVVADIGSAFFARCVRGISDAGRARGYEVLVVNTDEDVDAERAAVRLLVEHRAAGMIVAPAARIGGSHLVEAQTVGIPVVLMDRRVRGLDTDRVAGDNRGGAKLAMEQLIRAGHRRIAFVSSAAGPHGAPRGQHPPVDDLVTSGGDRARAYLDALSEAAVKDPGYYLRLCPFGEEAAYTATTELLALPKPPTAVFASDSVIALGVLRAVHDVGALIPQDVSVVAGDDPSWSSVTTPELSSIDQPVYDLGHTAMNLLLDRLSEPDAPWRDVVLPTTFLNRGSIAPPARGSRRRLVHHEGPTIEQSG